MSTAQDALWQEANPDGNGMEKKTAQAIQTEPEETHRKTQVPRPTLPGRGERGEECYA